MSRQLGDIGKHVFVGVTVDQCISYIEYSLLGVENVHGAESLELRTNADDFLCHLDRVGVLGVKTGDEGISVALLYE